MFDVIGGDDRFDAGQCQGAAGVYGLDPSVGVRTAQDFTVQHPRKADVGAVVGPPGDLVGPVMPDGPGAYYVVLLGGKDDVGLVVEHALSPEKASCRSKLVVTIILSQEPSESGPAQTHLGECMHLTGNGVEGLVERLDHCNAAPAATGEMAKVPGFQRRVLFMQ